MARKDASIPPEGTPITRADARRTTPHSEPVTPKALPSDLQSLVDRSDSLYESLYDGTAPDTTTSSVRYAAYATRLRTILLSAQRYVAYTSDIGESFRPVAHPWLIRGAYGVSWAYLCGDVANEGYKAYVRNQRIAEDDAVDTDTAADVGADKRAVLTRTSIPTAPLQRQQIPAIEDYRAVMAQRAVFQSLASMGLPAFTIHSIVRYSGRAMKDVANKRLRSWGPIGVRFARRHLLRGLFKSEMN